MSVSPQVYEKYNFKALSCIFCLSFQNIFLFVAYFAGFNFHMTKPLLSFRNFLVLQVGFFWVPLHFFWLCCAIFLIPSFSCLYSIVSIIFRILSVIGGCLPLYLFTSSHNEVVLYARVLKCLQFSSVFPLFYTSNLPFEVYSSCFFHFNFESTYKNLKYFPFYILSSLTSARQSVDPSM